MTEHKTDMYQHFLLLISILITLIPFFSGLDKEWKIVSVIFGGLFIWVYFQDLLKEKIVEITLESDQMKKLLEEQKQLNNSIKEDITEVKVWIKAITNFKKNKSGEARGIDPLTVLMVIIVTILIILILKGKI